MSATAAFSTADPRATLGRWLIALRWAICAILAAVIATSERYLYLPVNHVGSIGALLVLAVVNVAVMRIARFRSLTALAGGVALDMVAIAAVLASTGGSANPFTALLFAYVAIAASLFPWRMAFGLAGFAAVVFGALFLLPTDPACHQAGHFESHLYGMWVAFAVVALLVAVFVARLRSTIASRERELDALRARTAEDAKFAALGTLAAGTAHELGTPLGSIAVLAERLHVASDGSTTATAQQISEQVQRCKEIVKRMHAGAQRLSVAGGAELRAVVPRAISEWQAAHPNARVTLKHVGDATIPLSNEDVHAALNVLLDNALYATERGEHDAAIVVEAGADPSGAFVAVTDAGEGVPASHRERLGEPFFSTKEPGEGMGLGLYVVRSLLAQVGGRLEVIPGSVTGTCVRLMFPRALAAG